MGSREYGLHHLQEQFAWGHLQQWTSCVLPDTESSPDLRLSSPCLLKVQNSGKSTLLAKFLSCDVFVGVQSEELRVISLH